MEPQTLSSYVAERVRAGISKSDVKEQALAVGWSEDEADAAYAQALIELGMPVPDAATSGTYTKSSSTVDIVLNFFSFILLGIVTTALGVLYFQIIGKYFPDPLASSSYRLGFSSGAVHYAIAALIIGFPLYYAAMRLWFKKFRQDEAKTESRLTKWITYLVLLVVSVTVVGDLISVLFTFFQGEISVRFFLKALVVLVIAGMIFSFYYLERRKIQYRREIERHVFQWFGYALTGMVVMGIVIGFIVAGSPATERMRTFDERRADDLNSLASCVSRYTQQFERIPESLSELERSSNFTHCADTQDPETKETYEYRILTELHSTTENRMEAEFELCATFTSAADGETGSGYYRGSKWDEHTSGTACDAETVSVVLQNSGVRLTPELVPLPF